MEEEDFENDTSTLPSATIPETKQLLKELAQLISAYQPAFWQFETTKLNAPQAAQKKIQGCRAAMPLDTLV